MHIHIYFCYSIQQSILRLHFKVRVYLFKDSFRNGRNNKLAESLSGGLKNLIFSKSNLKNLDENASLSMSKLRTWSTLIFAMPFVKIFNTSPNSESVSNSQIRSKSVICQKMPAFEQLKNKLLGNSKKYLSTHQIGLNVKFLRVQ